VAPLINSQENGLLAGLSFTMTGNLIGRCISLGETIRFIVFKCGYKKYSKYNKLLEKKCRD
jgi:hypothetical protein